MLQWAILRQMRRALLRYGSPDIATGMNISPTTPPFRETDQPIPSGWRRACSFPVLLGTLLVLGAFLSTSWDGNAPGSKVFADDGVWWHIKVGEQMLATHTLPTSDPYSFTIKGEPWIAYEWLGEVAMALAVRAAGMRGLAGLLIVLSGVTLLLIYYYSYLRSGSSKAAFAASAVVLPMASAFFTGRPHVLGYLYLLVTLILLERFRNGHRQGLWWLPLIFLLWVNTHGTFVLGFVALGAYLVSGLVSFRFAFVTAEPWQPDERRRLLIVFLLSTLVLPLTPYGTRLAAYPLEMTLFQRITLTLNGEWLPLFRNNGPWGYVFVSLLFLFVLAQVFTGPLQMRLEELLLLLFAIGESLLHVRFLLFFAIIFAPLLAALLARWVPVYEPRNDKYALNAVLIALTVLVLGVWFPSNRAMNEAVNREYPEKAVDFLRQHPKVGPTFNETWGGYLLWSGRPVFIDGRFDLFEYAGVLADYIHIIHADGDTQFLFHKWGVRSCLVKKTTPLHVFLASQPGWKQAYEDNVSLLFVRQSDDQAMVPSVTQRPSVKAQAAMKNAR